MGSSSHKSFGLLFFYNSPIVFFYYYAIQVVPENAAASSRTCFWSCETRSGGSQSRLWLWPWSSDGTRSNQTAWSVPSVLADTANRLLISGRGEAGLLSSSTCPEATSWIWLGVGQVAGVVVEAARTKISRSPPARSGLRASTATVLRPCWC